LKKTVLVVLVIILGAGAFFALSTYRKIFSANLQWPAHKNFFYLPTGSTFSAVKDSLAPYLSNVESFAWVARKKNYQGRVKPGRYILEDGMSNNALINKLRSGNQAPLNLIVYGLRDLGELSAFLGNNLEYDSAAYYQAYTSTNFLDSFNLKQEEVLGQFIPNTYEFYWNSSPAYTLDRMQKEAARFWRQYRDELENLGLSAHEVITLASIVESETAQPDEMPMVARLYLNRLERGIKLQSDPTVIFAIKQDNPGSKKIKRVLFKHLKHKSPYNTYQNKGLPPGPIKLPSVQAIRAVLEPSQHTYIFMVADPERPGYHNFAKTLREHNQNRAKYIQWVRRQNY
jgi:UPF0755 protein